MTPAIQLRLGLIKGALKDQPIKWIIVTLSIAVGVSLGLAVHLIHKQALAQFDSGVRQFSGNADLLFLPHGTELDQLLIRRLNALPEVSALSPVIEEEVFVAELNRPVTWAGVDVFRAGPITPFLVGTLDDDQEGLAFLNPTSVFVSPLIRDLIDSKQLTSRFNLEEKRWNIVGTVAQANQNEALVISDIAAAQDAFIKGPSLSRIDIKLKEGATVEGFTSQHSASFSAEGRFETPENKASRGAAVSQAYRANLSILAMVALLTGGFLSFSTQMLSVAQRARQWALLGAIGMTQKSLEKQIFLESSLSGLIGGLIGLALGWIIAYAILNTIGVDLGAGYFEQTSTSVPLGIVESLVFLGFAMAATTLGAVLPARQASQMALSGRLKVGSEETGLEISGASSRAGIALLALAFLAIWIPPIDSIPVGGYLGIAFGLFGGLGLLGSLVNWLVKPPQQLSRLTDLAATRLAATPNLLAIGLSGVVASFALVVAMHVMIYSFRESLDEWLIDVLPAPLYVSLSEQSSLSRLPEPLIQQLESLPKNELQRWGQTDLYLDPNRPAVKLIVRNIDLQNPQAALPLIAQPKANIAMSDANVLPIWPSEPAANLYNLEVGSQFEIRIANNLQVKVEVAGIWRDYARQHGALVIDSTQLQEKFAYTMPPTQLAVWPKEGSMTLWLSEIENYIQANELQGALRVSQPETIRQISLDIFDRSFAITYLLEVAAVLIGLFGVATTFSAIALSRQREFALISALGGSKANIGRLSIAEGILSAWVATLAGLVMGLMFAAVLIYIVNPQSFNWGMQWNTPWTDLILFSTLFMLVATITVAASTRRALASKPLFQLKEDWS